MSGIKEGDWVVVVRNSRCGCESVNLGKIFKVRRVDAREGVCNYCEARDPDPSALVTDDGWVQLYRLKKLEGDPITTDVEEQIVHPVSA